MHVPVEPIHRHVQQGKRTEPKRPLQMPKKYLLALCIRGFAGAQQRAVAFARSGEAGAVPVGVLGVGGGLVFVGHEGEEEDVVPELGGEDAEERALDLVVCGWGHGDGRG